MKFSPFANQMACGTRGHFSYDNITIKIKRRFLSLILGVKMRRIMFPVKHSNYDSEEKRYIRHISVFHQLTNGGLNILRLRKDEIFELRGVADKRVGGADAADGSVEVFEEVV
jgi:hypothetical protein